MKLISLHCLVLTMNVYICNAHAPDSHRNTTDHVWIYCVLSFDTLVPLISPAIIVASWGYQTPPPPRGLKKGPCLLSGDLLWKQSIVAYFQQSSPVDFIKQLLQFPHTLSGGPGRVSATAERGIIVSVLEWGDISTSSFRTFSSLPCIARTFHRSSLVHWISAFFSFHSWY